MLKYLFLSIAFASSLAHASDFSLLTLFKTSTVTSNRDGSVTLHWPKAHNGNEYLPIRFDTPRDFDSACKLLGHDAALKYPGLNLAIESDKLKLMFNKSETLEDLPMREGLLIKKLTCFKREHFKTSVQAKVRKNEDGSGAYYDIKVLVGDLKYRISSDLDEGSDRVCRFLGKARALSSEAGEIRSKRGNYVVLSGAPKMTTIAEASGFFLSVTCSAE